MKKMLSYLKAYKLESILGPLFKLLEASFELFVPLVVAAIIDKGIAGGDRSYVLRMALVLVSLGLVGLVSSVTAQYFCAKAAVGIATGLRRALFAKIQTLTYSDLDEIGTSTLITRMTSDVNQVQSGINLLLRLFLRSPFIVFGAMIMAFTINVKAALIFAVAIPVLSVVVFGIMLLTMPMYRKVQEKLDGVLRITRENLTGVRVIRAFCKEASEVDEFDKRNKLLNKIQQAVGRISALMNPLTYVLINFAIIWLIQTGGELVNDSILTKGEVVALYNYMSQILIELIKLANLIITVTKAAACTARVSKVLEFESPKTSLPYAKENTDRRIEFRSVTATYRNAGDHAVENISFSAKPGEVIGIIGGTGAGKTTIANLIPRFYDCTAGEVLVDGVNVQAWDSAELRAKIGIVPQRAQLFKGTIRENLRWGDPDATDEAIWEALKIAQAVDVVRSKEGGLDALVEQGGRNLSGGQRQRLTIARALVKKPEILILDDSASALDYATDAALRHALREMEGAPTVVIISQRTSSLMHADRIVVLDDGKVEGLGTHSELLEGCPIYREIYYSQYPKEVQA